MTDGNFVTQKQLRRFKNDLDWTLNNLQDDWSEGIHYLMDQWDQQRELNRRMAEGLRRLQAVVTELAEAAASRDAQSSEPFPFTDEAGGEPMLPPKWRFEHEVGA